MQRLFLSLLTFCGIAMGWTDTAGIVQSAKDSLEFELYVPASYDSRQSYPLVLYLHGYTIDPFVDSPWFQDQLQQQEPTFVLVPRCPAAWGASAWGGTYDSGLRPAMTLALAVLDSLQSVYSIDPRRLYAYGGSMGGEGVFALLAYRPGLLAAGVSVAGYTTTAAASTMAGTPLWIIHGSNDDLNPTSSSRNIYAAIRTAGGTQVRYSEYPGEDHYSIWDYVTQETDIVPWMLAQVKDSSFTDTSGAIQYPLCLTDQTSRTIVWQAPTDGTAPWFYSIYRNDTLIAELRSTENEYTDHLGNATDYAVRATSYHFLESPFQSFTCDPSPLRHGSSGDSGVDIHWSGPVLQITFTGIESSRGILQIHDLQGRRLFQATVANGESVSISDLPCGACFVSIEDAATVQTHLTVR